ncbi:toll-like receptor 4 [Mytilus galloprovincialis]|uniref:toll-like receptor 4 n=1 Tax=Mytilus galloprovincialis TaxID=29158 RepID=UPI003F7C462E
MTYAFNCSSNASCLCVNTPSGLIADCSGLGLTKVPLFTDRVISVNLSKNCLTTLPPEGSLPSKLKYLDLSVNMIRNFSTDGTLPFSTTKHMLSLNLSYNMILLDRDTYFDGIFRNLRQLQHLDVSYNSLGNRSYYCPDEVFQELQSLQRLHIDAVLNVSFGKGFLALRQLTHLKLTGLATRITIPNNYFLHLPNLISLDMSAQWDTQGLFTGLEHIESGTFRRLAHLEILDISYNRKLGLCGFTNVTHDLPFTSIKVFKAQYLACERGGSTLLFNNDIKPLLNTNIEELYIDGNNLDKTEARITLFIPKSLRYISATDNRWIVGPYSYYDMLMNLTNIKKIDLSFQNRHQMSQSVNSWKCDHIESVAEIGCLCKRYPYKVNTHHLTFKPDLPFNQKSKLDNANHSATLHSCVPYFYPSFQLVIVPPNIEEIKMESARVGYSIPPLYISTSAVKTLILRNNQLYSFIGPMCNFTNLQFLDLSGNKATDISSYVFGALPSLRHLALDNNILGNSKIFFTVDSKHLFENQTNLAFLNISSNSISILFQDLLLRSTYLKHIYLDHNLLVDWNVTIEHMKNLEILDISWNQILYLSPNGMQLLDNSFTTNVSINMLNNPLHCSCDSVTFFEWIQKHSKHFLHFKNYTCSYKGDIYEINTATMRLKKDCASYIEVVVLSVILIITFIAVVCTLLVYRFRWKLRYLYYVMKGAYGYHRLETEDHYQFDAFVSYADSDRHFPKDEMVDYLERQRNFRLCIHHRDFIAGCGIAENITNAIHNSRKVVCVLSEDFLKSEWCMYEFNIALIERTVARQGQNMIIMLRLGRVNMKNITTEIMYILKEDTYIEYPENEEDRRIFWEDFAESLDS